MEPLPPQYITRGKKKLVRGIDAITRIERLALDIETEIIGDAKSQLADILSAVGQALLKGALGDVLGAIEGNSKQDKLIKKVAELRDQAASLLENKYLFNGTTSRRIKKVYSRN